MRRVLFTLAVLVLLPRVDLGQTTSKDINSVIAAGKVTTNQYRNDFFGLSVTAKDGVINAPTFVNVDAQRARLSDVSSSVKEADNRYSVGVLADSLAKNPLIHSPEQYIRAVRHQLEKERLETVRQEFPIEVSGIPFVGAVMKANTRGQIFFRGLYGTFLNGYILSFDVKAVSPERVQELVSSMIQFKIQNK